MQHYWRRHIKWHHLFYERSFSAWEFVLVITSQQQWEPGNRAGSPQRQTRPSKTISRLVLQWPKHEAAIKWIEAQWNIARTQHNCTQNHLARTSDDVISVEANWVIGQTVLIRLQHLLSWVCGVSWRIILQWKIDCIKYPKSHSYWKLIDQYHICFEQPKLKSDQDWTFIHWQHYWDSYCQWIWLLFCFFLLSFFAYFRYLDRSI